jgi:cyclase
MFQPRIIPVLLLKNNGLYKSVKFKNHHYIGDPINAVKIFNDLKADELVFLDIEASKQNRLISLDFVKEVGEEANMPFAVGGGIKNLSDIQKIISAGAEKVVITTSALQNPNFISDASNTFGKSTIAVCMDVNKNIFGKNKVYSLAGSKAYDFTPMDYAKLMQDKGAGEIIVQSIALDGTMNGYDLDLILSISKAVTIPVIALGGAGKMEHLKQAFYQSYANGLAAGSMFVYQGTKKGVLINYPENNEKQL